MHGCNGGANLWCADSTWLVDGVMMSPYLLHGLGRGGYAAVSAGFEKLLDS